MNKKWIDKVVNKIKLKRIKKLPKWQQGKEKFKIKYSGKYSYGVATYGMPIIDDYGSDSNLTIGSYCSIAYGVRIFLGGNHRIDWVSTYPFPLMTEGKVKSIKNSSTSKGDVYIGNDVWIGSCAVIMSGLSIGDGAVVAANAVVTKDVPPYAIVAGNPAKVVKFRFPPEIIDALLEIGWWNWPIEKVEQFSPDLCNENIELFIHKFLKSEPLATKSKAPVTN